MTSGYYESFMEAAKWFDRKAVYMREAKKAWNMTIKLRKMVVKK
jgi:hypothetical protein